MENYEIRLVVSTSRKENNSVDNSWGFDIEAENLKEAIDKSAEKLKEVLYGGMQRCSMEICIKG